MSIGRLPPTPGPTPPVRTSDTPAAKAAQRAFFAAAVQAPAAPQPAALPVPTAKRPEAASTPTPESAPDRVLRPGSLLDIKV